MDIHGPAVVDLSPAMGKGPGAFDPVVRTRLARVSRFARMDDRDPAASCGLREPSMGADGQAAQRRGSGCDRWQPSAGGSGIARYTSCCSGMACT